MHSTGSEDNNIMAVDLVKLTAEHIKGKEGVIAWKEAVNTEQSAGGTKPKEFFPLAIDDYFMAVAILSRELGQVCLLLLVNVDL